MTCQHLQKFNYKYKLLLFVLGLVAVFFTSSCGIVGWHSIEQTPAEPIAYIRDSVFLSGNYARSAQIIQVDGNDVSTAENRLLEINLGKRAIKINCDEAKGNFDTNEFSGQSKILEFEAQIQRTYRVGCIPYTHWWIEDIDNKKVVAGKKSN